MNSSRLFLFGVIFTGSFVATASAQTPQKLTLQEAEQIALLNHPQIQKALNLASAASAQVSEERSAYFPLAFGSLTGATSEHDSRIAAGALSNPLIFERYANGLTVGQLLTDFGRTHELVKSSRFRAQAEQAKVVTARADVLLELRRAYYTALKAQAVLKVAEETVKARQLVADQVTALAQSKLKSGLDVSFANVNLAQAKLILVQSQNDAQASFAELSNALGYSDQRSFELAEEPLPPPPLSDVTPLIQEALQNRPELATQRFDVSAARSFATAERDLWFPSLTAVGSAGLVPYRQDTLASRYAATGFNLNIPIFNGHLFSALRVEANSRARAEDQTLRDLQDRVVRDVRIAWLGANSAFQRLSLTDQLLAQASQAMDLAQARYNLGLGSIVELSQAQLNKTEAEIQQASAKYDYQSQLSTLDYQVGRLR